MIALLLALAACDGRPLCATGPREDADGDGAWAWPGCDATATACTPSTWYADLDGDGHGDPGNAGSACDQPAGWLAEAGDCDDRRPDLHPGVPEACDGVDQDCDGEVDEDAPADHAWYADGDGDGWGAGFAQASCLPPEGTAPQDGDCDDQDAAVHPGAAEVFYDGVDQDCDPRTPDDDADGDGHDVGDWRECDDTDPDVHHGALETCGDGVDQNCDGVADVACGFLADADARVHGEEELGWLGATVAGAGDVDGDGAADLLVSVQGYHGIGAALLFSGAPTGLLGPEDADTLLLGDQVSQGFGMAVGAGDVDGDGFADVLVGAPSDYRGGVDAGAAFLFHGPLSGRVDASVASARLLGDAEDAWAGTTLAGGGDVDGDGVPDAAIGGRSAVWIVTDLGRDASLSEAAGHLATTASGVEIVGDLDGDGLDDLAVATSDAYFDWSGASTVRVHLAPIVGEVDPADADAGLDVADAVEPGLSVGGRGDADGDGRADLLVGLPNNGTVAGRACLFRGPVRGTLDCAAADAWFDDEGLYSWYARAAWVGDVDGDGRDDVAAGVPDDPVEGAGAVWLFAGPFAGTVGLADAAATFAAEPRDDATYRGFSLAAAGDLDGDGLGDVLVGAPYATPDGLFVGGAAYVLLAPFP